MIYCRVSSHPAVHTCHASNRTRTRATCRKETIADLVRTRCGWLLLFFIGLIGAAIVVEAFEQMLKKRVELSYFVPLLIGHGGNTGSQSNATIIRALAMGQVRGMCCRTTLCVADFTAVVSAAQLKSDPSAIFFRSGQQTRFV